MSNSCGTFCKYVKWVLVTLLELGAGLACLAAFDDVTGKFVFFNILEVVLIVATIGLLFPLFERKLRIKIKWFALLTGAGQIALAVWMISTGYGMLKFTLGFSIGAFVVYFWAVIMALFGKGKSGGSSSDSSSSTGKSWFAYCRICGGSHYDLNGKSDAINGISHQSYCDGDKRYIESLPANNNTPFAKYTYVNMSCRHCDQKYRVLDARYLSCINDFQKKYPCPNGLHDTVVKFSK